MLIVTFDCIYCYCEGPRPSCDYTVKLNALVPTVMDLTDKGGRFLRFSTCQLSG